MTQTTRASWILRALTAVGVVTAGLALAACSSSPATSSTSSTTSAAASGASATTVDSSSPSSYGTILVTSTGRTLYTLSADTPTTSACTGSCPTVWPPLTTTAAPGAGTGVQASMLGTITRSDGTKQVTYGGHPLYTYSSDSAAGQVGGEGITSFGGTWYVLGASGQPVKSAVSSTTTTSGGYGGY